MAEHAVPVDLFNPGQVFACLGFLEAADVLLGDAEGGFDWRDETNTKFILSGVGERNPFEVVLEFLAEAEPKRWGPIGYADPPPKKGRQSDNDDGDASQDIEDTEGESVAPSLELSEVFCAKEGDRMSLPIRFGGGNRPVVELGHWADGSSRESFKLYAGNRSADRIAHAMLKRVLRLWETSRGALIERPFHVLAPMGGSFNFDPRGAWTAIGAGYSLNNQKHAIESSPVVEFLAAWGLEHARPDEFETRQVRYATWGALLPAILARTALTGAVSSLPMKRFRFELDLSGKNKVVTFAQQEGDDDEFD